LALVGGLPGTGKSTVAGALADRVGAVLLSSDRIRKELAGLDPSDDASAPYGEGLYAPARTDELYGQVLHRAASCSPGVSRWSSTRRGRNARGTGGRPRRSDRHIAQRTSSPALHAPETWPMSGSPHAARSASDRDRGVAGRHWAVDAARGPRRDRVTKGRSPGRPSGAAAELGGKTSRSRGLGSSALRG
jgi:hypothetical protein